MDLYVFSTLASDVAYTNHTPGGGDMPIAQDPVVIKGGAGVANDRLVTPRGVMTRVTAEQVEYLRQNEVFKMHEANGFITISESSADADVVAADMTGRDESAPVVPQDNVAGDDTATVVGGEVVQEAAAPKTSKKK
jgi:hypothetical protein